MDDILEGTKGRYLELDSAHEKCRKFANMHCTSTKKKETRAIFTNQVLKLIANKTRGFKSMVWKSGTMVQSK